MLKVLLSLPLLLFVGIIFADTNLLLENYTVGPMFGYQYTGNVLQMAAIFFILYIILIYLYYTGVNVTQTNRIGVLEREIVELKSELYSDQAHLIEKVMNDYREKMDSLEKTTDAKLERIVKFNEYTLDKIVATTNSDFDKYKKETRKLLAQADIKDKTLLEKLKMWE